MMGAHKDDAAGEQHAVPLASLTDKLIQPCQQGGCEDATHRLEGDVDDHVLHQTFKQLHLRTASQMQLGVGSHSGYTLMVDV